MRTKEEILQKLPTDLSEIEKYEGINNLECRVRVGTLETLLDIRDILAEAFKEEIVVKEPEKHEDMGEFEEAVKT